MAKTSVVAAAVVSIVSPPLKASKFSSLLLPLLMAVVLLLSGTTPSRAFPLFVRSSLVNKRSTIVSSTILHLSYQDHDTDQDHNTDQDRSPLYGNDFDVGDSVMWMDDVVAGEDPTSRKPNMGRIQGVRGKGWYAVATPDGDIVKCRANQLHHIGNDHLSTSLSLLETDSSIEQALHRSALVEQALHENAVLLEQKTQSMNETPKTEQKMLSKKAISKIRQKMQTMKAASKTTLPHPKTETTTRSHGRRRRRKEEYDPPAVTIYDLDFARQMKDSNDPDEEYWRQVDHFATYDKWIAFSDLHCSHSTIDTCLEVLDKVHDVAQLYDAGIMFLGDWWHVRGTLRVGVLNSVLKRLADFTQPMIMIPGNHDQVTLETTDNHSLRVFRDSYRVPVVQEDDNKANGDTENPMESVPGALVFSHPTKFMDALWIPHIRSPERLERVVSSASDNTKAIFCHADVTGACMNDNIVSNGGVSPRIFPSMPVYTGHFHKPHKIPIGQNKNNTIEYLGSPYQVSLSEAEQDKNLLLLSQKSSWQCLKRIPINIGRKHFKPRSLSELLDLNLGEELQDGDRVVWSINKRELGSELEEIRQEMDSDADDDTLLNTVLDDHVETLRKNGVMVEIRQTKEKFAAADGMDQNIQRALATDELSNAGLWEAFLEQEVKREAMTRIKSKKLLAKGKDLLEEIEAKGDFAQLSQNKKASEFQLHSVTLNGFGPFREEVTYPLSDRGLVLIRGRNMDGGSDSNGTGKTSLAMSILWALTGSLDPRPAQDFKVSGVVNDDSKVAKVTVKGSLNGVDFSICRMKTLTKGNLYFVFDNKDLSTQSVKETQALIYEKLGISPQILARTMFHGQHPLNELLDCGDSQLKEELCVVTPLAIWQKAASTTKKRSREALKRVSELEGMLSVRTDDVERLEKNVEAAEKVFEESLRSFNKTTDGILKEIVSLEKQLKVIGNSPGDRDFLEKIELELGWADQSIEDIESDLKEASGKRDKEIALQQEKIDIHTGELEDIESELRIAEREYHEHAVQLALAQERRLVSEQKWNVDLSSGIAPSSVVLPKYCPTCMQPLSRSSQGHGHEAMRRNILEDTATAVAALRSTEDGLQEASDAMYKHAYAKNEAKEKVEEAKKRLEGIITFWTGVLQPLNDRLQSARESRQSLSSRFANAVKKFELESRLQTLSAKLGSERDSLSRVEEVLHKAKSEFSEYEKKVSKIRSEKEERSKYAAIMSELSVAFGQKGIETFLMQNAVSALESLSQSYLDQLSEGTQRLHCALESGERISRKAFVRDADGIFKQRPLASLSGGQWRRCSLAMNLGFADLVSLQGNFHPSLCVLDEPLTHLDQSGRADVGKMLRKLLRRGTESRSRRGFEVSTILIILQDLAAEELEQVFDHVDEVVKEKGNSWVSMEHEP